LKFNKSHLVNLAMMAALLATAIAGYLFSPLLLPKADVTGVVEPGCDLQQRACPATLPQGGRLELSVTPRPIPFLRPLRVDVSITGVEARKVEVDFAGATMNMGYNRTELAATGPGRHSGETSLPVCVSGSMAWVATVMIETDRQRIAVPFRFDVGH
jgi:hypothetical protein